MDKSYNKNSRIKIADLTEKNGIEDSNLIIVEDRDDTKKSTIHELKKAFSGDAYNPDLFKFYSSKKVQELFYLLSIDISSKAKIEDVEELRKNLSSIIANNGNGEVPTEVIDARNGYDTLGDRLRIDKELYDNKYVHNLPKRIVGNKQYIKGNNHVNILISDPSDDRPLTGTLTVKSNNLLNCDGNIRASFNNPEGMPSGWEKNQSNNGLKYTPHSHTVSSHDSIFNEDIITISFDASLQPGRYFLSYNIINTMHTSFLTNENQDKLMVQVIYNDSTSLTTSGALNYLYNGEPRSLTFNFNAVKPVKEIRFTVIIAYDGNNKTGKYPQSGKLYINQIMVYEAANKTSAFIPYYKETFNYTGQKAVVLNDFVNKSYTYEYASARQTEQMVISYYDTTIDIQWIYDELDKLNKVVDDRMDKCGLITDYGIYQYLDKLYVSKYENWINIELDEEHARNGVPSRKITIVDNAEGNSIMRLPLDNPIDVIESMGIYFYIDRTDYSLFASDTGGIKIRLCSDSIQHESMANYYEYRITKKEMVQGWNFVKKRFHQDFTAVGLPNPNNINYIYIEICRTGEMNGRSLYLNSFVFNQKMKPSVLMCFDGAWDTSVSYLYPYMQTRGIKATVFLNSSRTLEPETVDALLKYKIKYGWDIGLNSCHPNKEILIEDDNYRNQYVALLNSKEWLKNTMVSSPVGFSSAYGNLRPITVPILKDMGIKMVKTDGDGYCGFFSDKDFSLPSQLIDINTTAESIIDKIDYAIETGQTLVLYTTDVTEYGGERIAKKSIFETIINYISERIKDNERHIDCLTFSEFYDKCVIK